MLEETSKKVTKTSTKKTDKTVVETKEPIEAPVETSSEAPVEEAVTKKENNEPKMGVVRFLQLKPQSFTIETLLKKTHAMDVMTLSEWEKTLNDILNKRITE